MELLIITGMSGAGKSQVANVFEDIGYYCVDNIPPKLIPSIVDIANAGNSGIEKLAIITDIRGGFLFKDVSSVLDGLTNTGVDYKILFLDASDEVLVRRYKELRRPHPLAENSTISKALSVERNLLSDLRQRADYVVDTSLTSVIQLRENIKSTFLGDIKGAMKVQCMSFGFKYGAASEADLVFDVRCLPNPYYIDTLKDKTGLDREVYDYVLSFGESKEFAKKITELLDFSAGLYCKEGKSILTVAFGCTGGKHRSVTFAEYVADYFRKKGYETIINHRDINR